VIEVGSRAVRLSWQPPFDGHSKLLGYSVQYKALPPSSHGEVTDWQHANTLNLSISAVEAGGLAMGYRTHSLFLALVLQAATFPFMYRILKITL
jgi:hypothetical protein